MSTYALFYDGILEEQFETTEELAIAKYVDIISVETQEGDQLYNTIELYEMKKIKEYKFEDEVKDETK